MESTNSCNFARSLSSSKRGFLLRLVTSMSAMVGEDRLREREREKAEKKNRNN